MRLQTEMFGKKYAINLDDNKVMIIVGAHRTGKTSLLKALPDTDDYMVHYIDPSKGVGREECMYFLIQASENLEATTVKHFEKKIDTYLKLLAHFPKVGHLNNFDLSQGEIAFLTQLTQLYNAQNLGLRYGKSNVFALDTPENFLSLELHKEVLPLIRTLFPNVPLIVATHSPFIFDNIFDRYTVGITELLCEN